MEHEGDGDWIEGHHVRIHYEPRIERYVAQIDFPIECGAVGFTEDEAREHLRDKLRAMRKVSLE